MARNYTPKDLGDMNLMKLFEQFGSDDKCREYLEQLRWPDGLTCPQCGSVSVARVPSRKQYDCNSCRYKYSVLAGTIFHDTKLPLSKWFAATYLMIESRKGISANQMKRTLGVSYKTAWYLCHRIRAAMGSVAERPLEGVIEVDETYVGTVESAWSLLKRSIVGSYHQLSARHLPAYLEEMEWRFKNRDNPFMFRDTMLALIHSGNLPYAELTA